MVCQNGRVDAYIDDTLYCSHDFGTIAPGRISAHAGYDKEAGEIVVKVVNAQAEPLPLALNINASAMASEADRIVLKGANLWEENSFSAPELVVPVADKVAVENTVEFDPSSVTLLRIEA